MYSGKGKRKTTRALLTLTERKTRKEIIIAIPNRKAETVVKALDALERKLGARRFRAIFKSITFDNGPEIAAAEALDLKAKRARERKEEQLQHEKNLRQGQLAHEKAVERRAEREAAEAAKAAEKDTTPCQAMTV